MTRATKRIDMNELLQRFEDLKQTNEIRFDKNIIQQLNQFSTRKFVDTTDYLMKLDHLS